ncbi:MAG: glycosyltransferase [Muribaculaceae bacterium]|nr:glycosyltransferase [Muribaculaceae bacterium]
MRLSIIIPVYNTAQYLEECITSLFNQGLNEDAFEILMIDDGSKDNSLEVANQLASLHRNIRVFHQENHGQAVARNLGIDEAKGKYLMFVDSDDYLQPDKVSKLLNIVDLNSLDAIIYNLLIQQKNGDIQTQKIPKVKYNQIFSGEEAAIRYFVFGSMCRGIFLTKLFQEKNIRFRSGFTHEDSELCFRLFPLLRRVMFADKDVYFYRYNNSSTDRSIDRLKVLMNIESDAILVSKVYYDLRTGTYSNNFRKRYETLLNSIMIGFFFRLRSQKIWEKEEIDEKIDWLKEIGVYPLKVNFKSYKSLLVSFIFNSKILLKYFLSI